MIGSDHKRKSTVLCPSRKDLRDFLSGNLPDESADERIAAHAEKCSRCQRLLGELSQDTDTIAIFMRGAVGNFEEEDGCQELMGKLRAMPVGFLSRSQSLSNTDQDWQPQPEPEPIPNPFGKYELLDQIGKGGMGRVFCARHSNLKSKVAVKILARERIRDERDVARFYGEMEAVGKLSSPHVIRATDAGRYKGHHFLVMEYCEGVNLSELLRRVGPLNCADACELVRQAALGLECAHQHGMVHRDVKPSNLFLTDGGIVKVLDLGLVWLQGDQTGEEPDDREFDNGASSEMIIGTADYMAPEQWTGNRNIDHRTDLYGLGCTLYRLLTGSPPFGADVLRRRDKMKAHLSGQIPRITELRPDLPEKLNEVFARTLAKRPVDRYDNTRQFLDAIGPLSADGDLARLARRAVVASDASTFDGPLSEATASDLKTSDPNAAEISGNRKIGWAVAATALLAITSISMVSLSRDGPTSKPPPVVRPARWVDLDFHDREVLISTDPVAQVVELQQNNQPELLLDTHEWLFVSLMETNKRDYTFRVTLKMKTKQDKPRYGGVNIGWRRDPTTGTQSGLLLRPRSRVHYSTGVREYYVSCNEFSRKTTRSTYENEFATGIADIADPEDEFVITVVVRDSRIAECLLNGTRADFGDSGRQKLSEFVVPDGKIGVHAKGSPCYFIQPQFRSR